MKSLALRRTLPLLAALALLLPAAAGAAEHRIGGGIHYWRTVDDLADEGFGDIEEDGTAYVASWQILPAGIFRFELGVEYFPDDFGGAFGEDVISPQAYVLVGHGLYAGVGAGLLYAEQFGREEGADDDDFSDPFYALRGGFEMTLVPRVHLDVNANYRTNAWEKLGDVDVGTLTLGAQLRIGIGGSR